VGTTLLVYCLARDFRLRRALRHRIDNARCPGCRQPLLGLPLLAESEVPTVRCTECGEAVELAAIGLTPADILPRS
jgi:Zn ribbon nucleic-acid-binding protein